VKICLSCSWLHLLRSRSLLKTRGDSQALTEAIEHARQRPSPYLDAQQAISVVLTDFGAKHNFHRQFNELFPYKPAQILGMQLYSMVAADDDWWIYTETQHRGHVYPHATYFMSPDNPEYTNFVQQQRASRDNT
jgi:hypothetical protein